MIELVGYKIWSEHAVVSELWAEPTLTLDVIADFLGNDSKACDVEVVHINSSWIAFCDKRQTTCSPSTQLINLNFLPHLEVVGIKADFPLWPLPGDVVVLKDVYVDHHNL